MKSIKSRFFESSVKEDNGSDVKDIIPVYAKTNKFVPNEETTSDDIHDHLYKSAEEDEVDFVTFGIETDEGDIVKVFVNEKDADAFEQALGDRLGDEDNIEDILYELSQEFDIIDVEWPADEEEDIKGSTEDSSVVPTETPTPIEADVKTVATESNDVNDEDILDEELIEESNQSVVKDWVAQKTNRAGELKSWKDSDSIKWDGDVIYSYGSHFPIAKMTHKDDIVLFTSKGYSNSTAKHKNYVRDALRSAGLNNIIHVPDPDGDVRTNVEEMRNSIEKLRDKILVSRPSDKRSYMIRQYNDQRQELLLYSVDFLNREIQYPDISDDELPRLKKDINADKKLARITKEPATEPAMESAYKNAVLKRILSEAEDASNSDSDDSDDSDDSVDNPLKRFETNQFQKFAIDVLLQLGFTPDLVNIVLRRSPTLLKTIRLKAQLLGTNNRNRIMDYLIKGTEGSGAVTEETSVDSLDMDKLDKYTNNQYIAFAVDILTHLGFDSDQIEYMFRRAPMTVRNIKQIVQTMGASTRAMILNIFANADHTTTQATVEGLAQNATEFDPDYDPDYEETDRAERFIKPTGTKTQYQHEITISSNRDSLTLKSDDFEATLDYNEMIDLIRALDHNRAISFKDEDGSTMYTFSPARNDDGYMLKTPNNQRGYHISPETVDRILQI